MTCLPHPEGFASVLQQQPSDGYHSSGTLPSLADHADHCDVS